MRRAPSWARTCQLASRPSLVAAPRRFTWSAGTPRQAQSSAGRPAGRAASHHPTAASQHGASKQEEEEEEVIYCLDQTQEERRSYEGWDGGGRRAAVRGAWVELEEVAEHQGRHETVSS